MRSLADAADAGDRLLLGCSACGASTWLPAGEICRAFRSWRIEELERAGVFRCSCGRSPAVMLYGTACGTGDVQLERWHGEQGWRRKVI